MRPLPFRPLLMLLPASLWLLPTLPASAQSSAYPASETAISTVQVSAPTTTFRASDSDIEEVSGNYAMSNGWRLKVEPSSRGLVARIDRQRPILMNAVSASRYVSRDGKVSMDFDLNSDDKQLRMSYVPADSRTAEMIVITTTLAQR